MSDNVAEYILRARDDASAVVAKLTGSVTDLREVFMTLATAAGPFGAIAVAAAAAGAAAAAMGVQFANSVEQMDRLVKNTGISADRLQALQRVVENGGGDVGALSTSLIKFNKALAEGDPLLKKIGVTSNDTYTAFLQLSSAITNSTDAKARDAVAIQLLGRAGGELVADLVNIKEHVDATYESMMRAGVLMKGPLVEEARRLDDNVDSIKNSWKDLGTLIAREVIPGVAEAANLLAGALAQMEGIETISARYKRQHDEAWMKKSDPEKVQYFLDVIKNERTFSKPGDEKAQARIDQYLQMIDYIIAGQKKSVAKAANGPDPLTKALEDLKHKNSTDVRASRDNVGLAMQWAAHPGPMNDSATINAYYVEQTRKIFEEIAKGLDAVQEPALKFTESGQRYADQDAASRASLDALRGTVASDIQSMVQTIFGGTESIADAFKQLIVKILSDIGTSAAEFGIGLLLNAIGLPLPVGGFGGHAKPGGKSAVPSGGGNTYYISTLDAKELVGELTDPTGQFRRAQDRVLEIAMAGR